MKKTLVTLLALVFVLGIAGTALAAPANPFVDVPAKHWAYGAVTKLAKAGIVDGYGDGTFRGDRTMTRYEMAQIVAKAMAKSEKADAELKALIDKLAVEFAAELNNLGVRVAKLEAKTNVGLTYESRIRWGKNDNKSSNKQATDAFDLRQRIYLAGVVNDKVDYGARIQGENVNGGASGNITLNRMFFNIKDFGGIDRLTVGRLPVYQGLGLLVGSTNGKDGFMITEKMGEVTFGGFYVDVANRSSVAMANFTFKPSKDVLFNAGYLTTNLSAMANWPANGLVATFKGHAVDVGVAAKLGDFWLKGEYVAGKIKDATAAWLYPHSPKAFAFELSNSVGPNFSATSALVNNQKAHTDAFAVGYRSVQQLALMSTLSAFGGQYSAITGTTGAANATSAVGFNDGNNNKGWYIRYQNVLSKGVVLTLDYADIKQKDVLAGDTQQKDKLWMGTLEFFF